MGRFFGMRGWRLNVSNGPETYMLDGKQYLVVGTGDSPYVFTLAE